MLALIEHSPDIYLDEIQEQLQELHGIKMSLSSIWRTLKRLGMSAKKVCSVLHFFLPKDFIKTCSKLSRVAAERCEEKRQQFCYEIGQYPPEYLVSADEAAVNILTTYRTNGWAVEGLRARKTCCFVRGTRYDQSHLFSARDTNKKQVFDAASDDDEWCYLQSHQERGIQWRRIHQMVDRAP